MIVIAIKEKEFGLVKLRTSMIPKLREISQITGNFFQSENFQADGLTHRVTAGPSCFHNIDEPPCDALSNTLSHMEVKFSSKPINTWFAYLSKKIQTSHPNMQCTAQLRKSRYDFLLNLLYAVYDMN